MGCHEVAAERRQLITRDTRTGINIIHQLKVAIERR